MTEERETISLRKAMIKCHLRKGYIITNDYEAEKKYPEGKIYFIPIYHKQCYHKQR